MEKTRFSNIRKKCPYCGKTYPSDSKRTSCSCKDHGSDTVKGTRSDGTYGSIKITGYPTPEHYRKKAAIERLQKVLDIKETELLELMTQAEEYIESIPKSEVRTMFRLYYIDGLPWWKVAQAMKIRCFRSGE